MPPDVLGPAVHWTPRPGALAPLAARTVNQLQQLLHESEFLARIRAIRERTSSAKPLTPEHRDALIANQCSAEDWRRIRVAPHFSPDRVHHVHFFGDCELGAFTADRVHIAEGVALPAGLYDCIILNSIIEDDACVSRVGTLANTYIGPGAVIANCNLITCSGRTSFGNNTEMPISIEVGGREVHSFAELTIPIAEAVAKNRHDALLLNSYQAFCAQVAASAECAFSIVEAGARITNTSKLVDVYIGPAAQIDNATLLQRTTILASPDEQTTISDGAWISDTIVQHGAHVASFAIVNKSVLCEYSCVERQGKVSQSIIGPNTSIAEGEVTASLVGPFVGFHHQSLLIAAMWPEGRGNIGSGANVGSNHTSKAPDQEIWPGEGAFFGLGVNIKYPSDLTAAPYTIFATAVNALPQRIEFPFSLINSPTRAHEGVSPGYNEITPGWVLSDDIYLVMRNEAKFRARNKARRTQLETEVFRPAIVDLMRDARVRLQQVPEVKHLYTDQDLAGLGKNFLLEKARLVAVESYTFYIRYYALRGFYQQVEKTLASEPSYDIREVLARQADNFRWQHERDVLAQEFPGLDAPELFYELLQHQEKVARDVQASKERDDSRGMRIISDYRDAHAPASQDPFVKTIWQQTRLVEEKVQKYLSIN
ncbi:MAG: DUF4954 family protein [Candidatus Sumerlaeaceae bacterium]